jgi:hypothetical protein
LIGEINAKMPQGKRSRSLPETKNDNITEPEQAKELVATIRIEGTEEAVREVKKLIGDAYISATKLAVILGKINARCR